MSRAAALSLAIGRTPRTEALFAPGQPWRIAPLAHVTRAFAPMLREGAYDASEMAIASLLMARAAGVPVVPLPVVLSARPQEASLRRLAAGPIRGPADLRGARVGVRAYSQTTGLWLRGILEERHGLPAQSMQWITFEDAHVAGFEDPRWVRRAPPGADLAGMLRAGALDAAIFGSDAPDDPDLAPVLADPEAEGRAFVAAHGFVPVNHLLVARRDVARDRPGALRGLIAALAAAGCPVPGRAGLAPVLALAARYAAAQGLIPRPFAPEEIWADTPSGLVP